MTALKAKRDSLSGRNRTVPCDGAGDNPQGGCGQCGVPGVGNVARLGEIEVDCPVISPACAPVSNVHVHDITVAPLITNRDLALQCGGGKRRCSGCAKEKEVFFQ